MSKSCSGGVRAGKARAASDEVVALAGCRVVRPSALAGTVEIVTASPEPRGFPTRVNEGLGVCLKLGPAHTVISDGRRASYPEDSVCVRDPGCVWSSEVAAVGFVSIDIAPAVLPRGLRYSPMRFLRPAALPDVRLLAQQLERARRTCSAMKPWRSSSTRSSGSGRCAPRSSKTVAQGRRGWSAPASFCTRCFRTIRASTAWRKRAA
jgi:hypothetical protein